MEWSRVVQCHSTDHSVGKETPVYVCDIGEQCVHTHTHTHKHTYYRSGNIKHRHTVLYKYYAPVELQSPGSSFPRLS